MRRIRGYTLVELLVVIAIIGVLMAILFPVYSTARQKAYETVCISNMRQLTLAILAYASNHNERLPDASTWVSDIMPHVKDQDIFKCRRDGSGEDCSYAMNAALSGRSLSMLNDTGVVLLYETATPGPCPYGGVEDIADPPRHNGGNIYGFADSHVKWHKKPPSFGP